MTLKWEYIDGVDEEREPLDALPSTACRSPMGNFLLTTCDRQMALHYGPIATPRSSEYDCVTVVDQTQKLFQMPRTCCCLPGCANRCGHEFQIDIDRWKAWFIAIRRVENALCKAWCPSESSVVRKAHFRS